MSTLVLELRQGDMMIVNGAPIRFRNRARIELTAPVNFLSLRALLPCAQPCAGRIRLWHQQAGA
jgi:flagellar protein FlbT